MSAPTELEIAAVVAALAALRGGAAELSRYEAWRAARIAARRPSAVRRRR